MGFTNFHTHTTWCDGADTPEEMVRAALENGCTELGFSGHGYAPYDGDCCMTEAGMAAYKAEVLALRENYAGDLKIHLGVERDYFSDLDTTAFDYVIGSVHYLYRDGDYIPVDLSADVLEKAAQKYYDGDIYALVEDYFRTVADVPRKTGCDILGHFDLITKFQERTPLFDENHPRYRAAALQALDAVLAQGALLEINTGAMSRGYRTTPYPAPFILEELAGRGCKAILSSDCHSADAVCHGFEKARALAAQYGVQLVEKPEKLA